MAPSSRRILIGSVLAALTIIFFGVFTYAIALQFTPPRVRPPELGGQKVPAKLFEVRFDQRYDIFCSFYEKEATVYRNCKILGFTGNDEESEAAARESGSGSLGFSSASLSDYYPVRYFHHWLVLELSDGRLAYIPPNAVKYMEQASTAGK